ncbi:roadblock/LC7 domain-containing protein [Streptomyces sp. NPDC006172]|uniref:roadblock/LC7 domain-containing protein n=1 Tax=Streptomyces sp. NPDC006172 TaxID=3154470 RepID=UPI0033EA5870
MAVEAEVLNELNRLRTRMPQLTGALAASVDGLVLAQDMPGVQPESLAALTAAALGVGYRMVDLTARGEFCELLVRGAGGYVATYAAGPSAVLTLLADDRANVGRLHLEGRRSGARIAGLMAARIAPGRPAPPQGPHAVTPLRALGALPVRIPRQFRVQRGPEHGGSA